MKGILLKEYKPARMLYKLFFELIAIPIVALFLPGVSIDSYLQLAILITLTSAVFALIWPIIAKYLLTILLYSAGILNLLLNTLIIWLLAQLFPGVQIETLWSAFMVSILIMGFRMLADAILNIDEEGSFYRLYTKRVAYKNSPIKEQLESSKELDDGTIFIEIDGLSADVLKFAVRNGYMPTLQQLMMEQGYKIREWVCEYGASTPVCQAGILQGKNKNLPAFRWFDRSEQKVKTGNNPQHSAEVLKEISNGKGLLADHGISIGNIFTGDAEESVATFSTLLNKKDRGLNYFYYYFLNPDNYLRSFVLFWIDVLSEIKDQLYLQAYNIQPRIRKQWTMPFIRGFLSIFMRDMLTSVLIGKMYEGIKNVYIVYAGYDFIAHENGLERGEAIKALTQTDRKISNIMKAAQTTPRKYRFVFLSDHGQSQGASFKQRYGYSIDKYISEIVGHSAGIEALELSEPEAVDQLSLILTEQSYESGKIHKAIGKLFRQKTRPLPSNKKVKKVLSDGSSSRADINKIVCLFSGNQAELYFKGNKKRVTVEEINEKYPKLINLLSSHPGVGFISVVSEKDGPLVIGKKGTRYLDSDKLKGQDPLLNFDKYAVDQLKQVNTYDTAADIIINSTLYRNTDEVAAFEEFISSHGGIGGGQTKPFIMFPKQFEYPAQPVYRSTELHKVMKSWLA
ncbi:MAG: phage holin family protein [Candidatus Dojkabacteria bacterium]|nr:MAG: phage holin family protein [Candidatus Dojkabacteria bacterium]